MEEIHNKVAERSKRGSMFRFVFARGDKEKIAAWRQDFARLLHVFNVRSFGLVRHSHQLSSPHLSAIFQTELALDSDTAVPNTHSVVTDTHTLVADSNTHTLVSDTHTKVADIHRSALTGQEGISGLNHSVGATYHPYTMERLPSPRLGQGCLIV